MHEEALHTESRLLELVGRHDREAFELLYRRYWSQLYDTAFQRLKNVQQAEDIVQEIFIGLWTRQDPLRIDNLPAYLHTAVRNRVLNYVARNKIAESFYEPLASLLPETAAADSPLMQKELLDLMKLYIASLPEKRKQIFVLYLYHNLSTREIAERLHISQKTVQNQLHATMKGLKSRMVPFLLVILLIRI
jgi:RNA polymerase sigma-70 factor (ECF subfamily)